MFASTNETIIVIIVHLFRRKRTYKAKSYNGFLFAFLGLHVQFFYWGVDWTACNAIRSPGSWLWLGYQIRWDCWSNCGWWRPGRGHYWDFRFGYNDLEVNKTENHSSWRFNEMGEMYFVKGIYKACVIGGFSISCHASYVKVDNDIKHLRLHHFSDGENVWGGVIAIVYLSGATSLSLRLPVVHWHVISRGFCWPQVPLMWTKVCWTREPSVVLP